MNLLEVDGLSVTFGGLKAVDDVSFSVEQNRTTGLIGPNGAGKTTVFNLISGFVRPTAGAVTFDGSRVEGKPAHEMARLGVSRTFQAPRVFKTYTVRDNMHTAAHLRGGRDSAAVIASCLTSVGLRHRVDAPAATLSQRETKLLSIAMSLATGPQLLLLDEPAAGLNDEETHELVQTIRRFAEERGVTICIIEHKMHVIMDICQHITVLSEGRVLAEGQPEEISQNQDVIDAYLGVPSAQD